VREVDFLPRRYRQAQRQRRLILVQVCATAAVGAALCGWVGVVRHNVSVRRTEIAGIEGQLQQRQSQLKTLATLRDRRRDWAAQVRRMNALGLEQDAERTVRAIDAAMPRGVSLTNLRLVPEAAQGKEAGSSLRVTLNGVAPDERQLAAFLTELSAVPFFQSVTKTTVSTSAQDGRSPQEFEITLLARPDSV
jgi:Tfp pilus assembly protein PilN